MFLYNYVVYVVISLMGPFYSNRLNFLPLYPSHYLTAFNPSYDYTYINNSGGFLWDAWQRVLSNPELSWWNRIASDPKLLVSTIVWVLCVWFIIELCLILPFRWLKRLVRYPNHRLETPQESRRRRGK